MNSTELQDLESRLQSLEKALRKLPPVHFQTARTLFQHLHRVQLENAENKMTSANLGVVFGRESPSSDSSKRLCEAFKTDIESGFCAATVLRSPVAAREWSDMGPKAKIVEILCDHADTIFNAAGGGGGGPADAGGAGRRRGGRPAARGASGGDAGGVAEEA